MNNQIDQNKGFNLIELAVALLILSIIGAYGFNTFRDYTTRAKITEAMHLANEIRQSVEAHVATRRTLPPSFHRNLLAQNMDVVEKVETVRTGTNQIRINVYIKPEVFPDNAEQQVFSLLGNINEGEISWDDCGSGGCLTDTSNLPTPIVVPPTPTTGSILIATAPTTPSGSTPSPAGPTPSPVVPTPSPAGSTPSPVVPTPPPAGSTPSPVVPTPPPAGSTPAPVVPAPSPVVPAPSPVLPTPSPVLPTPPIGRSSSSGWTGGEVRFIKSYGIIDDLVNLHIDREVHDSNYPMNPRVTGVGHEGGTNGWSAILSVNISKPDGSVNMTVYPALDFSPTAGVVPCYKVTDTNTVVKGKVVHSSSFGEDCQVIAGAETPTRPPSSDKSGSSLFSIPTSVPPAPDTPNTPPVGWTGAGWRGDYLICKEAHGTYGVNGLYRTDSRLFGNYSQTVVYPYVICAGGRPNYGMLSLTLSLTDGSMPEVTIYPERDFSPRETACYIVTKKPKVVLGDFDGRAGCNRRTP